MALSLKDWRFIMIKVEYIDVWGFEHAIRGMRNPMNSWERSDSLYGTANIELENGGVANKIICVAGENDIDLMKRLYKGGTEHRKYLRQISVSMDVVAPLYWWKEFDTYKVGVTSNSCSTMHKIHAKEFALDDFSHEHLTSTGIDLLENTIDLLNDWRDWYIRWDKISSVITKEIECKKDVWWQMIQLLPSSYNQRRTIKMNYENVMNIINQREHHKLDEWRNFVEKLKKLPYVMEIRDEKGTK